MPTSLCPGCHVPLPPRRSRGPAATYCSARCRQAVFRQRRAVVAIEPAAARASGATAGRLAGTDDQVAGAILEARTIAGAFIRLGREARPAFAWRCEKVGVALRDALDRQFPELP